MANSYVVFMGKARANGGAINFHLLGWKFRRDVRAIVDDGVEYGIAFAHTGGGEWFSGMAEDLCFSFLEAQDRLWSLRIDGVKDDSSEYLQEVLRVRADFLQDCKDLGFTPIVPVIEALIR